MRRELGGWGGAVVEEQLEEHDQQDRLLRHQDYS
jgi:hypothetical protein